LNFLQTTLLYHPKTKLFISHGGLKSISETLCAKVPALVIPFFAEQIRNSFLFKSLGIGVSLSKFDLTTENLVSSINTVLSDGKFYQRISKLQNLHMDKMRDSLDLGVFWAEFFIRHENVSESWFKIRPQSWTKFLMLDILALVFTTILCVLVSIIIILKLVFNAVK